MTQLADDLSSLAAGRTTARGIAEAHLDTIARREPVLRAFAWFDPNRVRAQADAVDTRRKAGRTAPLDGAIIGVKDVLDTFDMPSQYGSPIWAGHRPRSDAASVALARRAGAVIAGKTVTTEFATRHPGPTRNPVNGAHTPGGSSSGSAAGVAAGFFHLAFGTQTAGSIIRPAAFCGAHGFKPSFGTLHRAGMKVMSEGLDTIGLFARSLADIRLGMAAISGFRDGAEGPKSEGAPRLALTLGPAADMASPETRALLERTAEACRVAGATVTAIDLPAECQRAFDLHGVVMNAESAHALAWEMDHAAQQLSPVLRERMEWGAARTGEELLEARHAFAASRRAFFAAMEGFDALITPAAPGEAPEGIAWTGDPAFNSLWTSLHVPCAVFPAGSGPAGLPLGVQVVALRDSACLHWAEWVEARLAGQSQTRLAGQSQRQAT
jgi:Asp-tRNA(Asn)/Glu-tRNA(Gln) amidotransferase A subunit family amidase